MHSGMGFNWHGILYMVFCFSKIKKGTPLKSSWCSNRLEKEMVIAEFVFVDFSNIYIFKKNKNKKIMLSQVVQVWFLRAEIRSGTNFYNQDPTYTLVRRYKWNTWCWNHTEAGYNTKMTTSYNKVSESWWPYRVLITIKNSMWSVHWFLRRIFSGH